VAKQGIVPHTRAFIRSHVVPYLANLPCLHRGPIVGMSSAILVSFCNIRTPTTPPLCVYDPGAGELLAIRLPDGMPNGSGMSGLACCDRFLYVALQTGNIPAGAEPAGKPSLLIFERSTFRLLAVHQFRAARDVHSMCWSHDRLLVVSTGTDEVVGLSLQGTDVVAESLYWRPVEDQTRGDTHHLNGIACSPEGLLVSGFGKRRSDSWSSATSGFIFNATERRTVLDGLEQPHSVAMANSSVWFCESRRMAVRAAADGRSRVLPGYTRGLCSSGSFLFAATSVGRRTSRSTGAIVENSADAGEPTGRCTISCLDRETLSIVRTTECASLGEEIYDLLAIDGIGRWPLGPYPRDHAV
jgi:hypothetical protein